MIDQPGRGNVIKIGALIVATNPSHISRSKDKIRQENPYCSRVYQNRGIYHMTYIIKPASEICSEAGFVDI